jgi:hypothetical protein
VLGNPRRAVRLCNCGSGCSREDTWTRENGMCLFAWFASYYCQTAWLWVLQLASFREYVVWRSVLTNETHSHLRSQYRFRSSASVSGRCDMPRQCIWCRPTRPCSLHCWSSFPQFDLPSSCCTRRVCSHPNGPTARSDAERLVTLHEIPHADIPWAVRTAYVSIRSRCRRVGLHLAPVPSLSMTCLRPSVLCVSFRLLLLFLLVLKLSHPSAAQAFPCKICFDSVDLPFVSCSSFLWSRYSSRWLVVLVRCCSVSNVMCCCQAALVAIASPCRVISSLLVTQLVRP